MRLPSVTTSSGAFNMSYCSRTSEGIYLDIIPDPTTRPLPNPRLSTCDEDTFNIRQMNSISHSSSGSEYNKCEEEEPRTGSPGRIVKFLGVVSVMLSAIVLGLIVVTTLIGLRVSRFELDAIVTKDIYVDCVDALLEGHWMNGVYIVSWSGRPTKVYCDMATDGGGWQVIQRRRSGELDFYLEWDAYVRGFGDNTDEFWIGNDNLHQLTTQHVVSLRIDMMDWDGQRSFAKYDSMAVSSKESSYTLSAGGFSGPAGDSLKGHNGMGFSTRDKDNSISDHGNCAVLYQGAWWYSRCLDSNLNGPYHQGNLSSEARGIVWNTWRGLDYSLKWCEMKIRRASWKTR